MSTLTTAAYLVSSVLFILSLRGLSHPSSARRGNFLGILGMTIAIVTTLSNPGVLSYKEIGIAFLIGGLIGTSIAVRIQMTALPQLVAAFHSLVGLAAVFVAASAYYNPSAFNIGTVGFIPIGSLIDSPIEKSTLLLFELFCIPINRRANKQELKIAVKNNFLINKFI